MILRASFLTDGDFCRLDQILILLSRFVAEALPELVVGIPQIAAAGEKLRHLGGMGFGYAGVQQLPNLAVGGIFRSCRRTFFRPAMPSSAVRIRKWPWR